MSPAMTGPVTVTVRLDAVELTGVAVMVEEVIATGFTPLGVQDT